MDDPERNKHEEHVPPPMDPYARYQTPYTRHPSDPDNQNPFILFRRFADEQFQNFFAGVPRLFETTGTSRHQKADTTESAVDFEQELSRRLTEQTAHFERDMAEMIRQRNEVEEGWKKQMEQEREERRAELQRTIQRKQQEYDQNAAAMLERGLQNCPELNGDERRREWAVNKDLGHSSRNGFGRCPAFDTYKDDSLDTELDAYEAALWQANSIAKQEVGCPWKDTVVGRRSVWGNGLGWDGRRRARNIAIMPATTQPGVSIDQQDQRIDALSDLNIELDRGRSADERNGVVDIDPFAGDVELEQWLTRSSYSPLRLGNLANSKAFAFDKILQNILSGGQLSQTVVDSVDEPATSMQERLEGHLPWADAFEDLLALERTGRMVDEPRLTSKPDPLTWVMAMEARGSLGPDSKWSRCYNEWYKPSEDHLKALKTPEADSAAGVHASQASEDLPQESSHPVPHWIVALDRALGFDPFKSFETNEQSSSDETNVAKSEIIHDVPFLGARGMMWPSADSIIKMVETSSKFRDQRGASAMEDVQDPNRIVSKVTTVNTRMLPDGTRETKRVSKSTRANGREESSEVIETIPAEPRTRNTHNTQRFTAPTTSDAGKAGWFWK